MRYAVCEECGLVAEAEKVNVGVGFVGHYYHCGIAHECSVEDLLESKKGALEQALEADCNIARTQHLEESQCRCGQQVLIQLHGNPGRKDGKRVFYPDEPDRGADVFRCKSCHAPVAESVPGAEYT